MTNRAVTSEWTTNITTLNRPIQREVIEQTRQDQFLPLRPPHSSSSSLLPLFSLDEVGRGGLVVVVVVV